MYAASHFSHLLLGLRGPPRSLGFEGLLAAHVNFDLQAVTSFQTLKPVMPTLCCFDLLVAPSYHTHPTGVESLSK
jgi:hypothetical protein